MIEADRLNALALAEWRKLMGIREPCFEPTYPMTSLYDAVLLVDAVLAWKDIQGEQVWMFGLDSKRQICYCDWQWRARFYRNDQTESNDTGFTPAEAITKAFLRLRKVDMEKTDV